MHKLISYYTTKARLVEVWLFHPNDNCHMEIRSTNEESEGIVVLRAVVIDDEAIIVNDMLSELKDVKDISSARGFTDIDEALEYIKGNPVDMVFLDINMGSNNGIDVAKMVATIDQRSLLIFCTGYSEYALEAFRVNAQSYLLKPVNSKMIQETIEILKSKSIHKRSGLEIRTFGTFALILEGKHIKLSGIPEEVLAFLVDKEGTTVTRAELAAHVLESDTFDRNIQGKINDSIKSLKKILSDNGISDILFHEGGKLAIKPDLFTCDLYEAFAGNEKYISRYMGEYLSSYSWAEEKNSILTDRFLKK